MIGRIGKNFPLRVVEVIVRLDNRSRQFGWAFPRNSGVASSIAR